MQIILWHGQVIGENKFKDTKGTLKDPQIDDEQTK